MYYDLHFYSKAVKEKEKLSRKENVTLNLLSERKYIYSTVGIY